MFESLFVAATPSLTFSRYSVQHLNLTGFAAIQYTPAGVKPGKGRTKTLANPKMIYLGKNGITIKGQRKEDTVRLGHCGEPTLFVLIDHNGKGQSFELL